MTSCANLRDFLLTKKLKMNLYKVLINFQVVRSPEGINCVIKFN